MENNEIIFEEEQDNRFENVTISDEYKGNMDMDDENPWLHKNGIQQQGLCRRAALVLSL